MIDFTNKIILPKSKDVSLVRAAHKRSSIKKKKLTKENKEFLKYIKLIKK